MDENQELRETAEDMECIKALFGSQKVEEAISQAKRQEKIERERKQTMKKSMTVKRFSRKWTVFTAFVYLK